MIPWWWSWSLAAVGLAGIWLTGSRKRVGFLLGVAAQGLWIVYAFSTQQWGFVLTALAYGVVYARGWRAWGKDHVGRGRSPSPRLGDGDER